ncbi:Ran-binding protein 3 [Gracilariopsis chorda]|uniref:Ran-binding protein 3 n=1 Tax=Gracilariopsis chorda TaxID=448386 RepID=A0A2V3II20_9FLOR|nr:Ran-binding protein 3 [Gracilariopsis chorda]|eukprot:PXF40790.1 Ran-binding protein 3 [Gracilariopsis chorda]
MKRAAEKQLTRDDVDDEADAEHTDGNAPFQRAAPEVLAKRRILKARRTIQPSAQPASNNSNPFATLRASQPEPPSEPQHAPPAAHAPPSEPAQPAPPADAQEAAQPVESPPPHPPASNPDQVETPPVSDKHQPPKPPSTQVQSAEPPSAVGAPVTAPEQPQPLAEQPAEKPPEQPQEEPAEPPATHPEKPLSDVPAKTAVPNKQPELPEPATPVKPAKPDSTTDAFKPKGAPPGDQPPHGENESDNANSNAQSAPSAEKPTAPEPSAAPKPASNATNGTKPAIIFGGASSLNTVSFATAAKTDNAFNFKNSQVKTPAAKATNHVFKEQPVTSGEEEETNLFRNRAKLYSLEGEQGKQSWRERGVGALKMNEHNETHKVRLLMRSEGVFRVILNTPLYDRIKLDRATERSIRFQGFEEQDAKCFLLRFATRDATSEFVAAVEKWKKSVQ